MKQGTTLHCFARYSVLNSNTIKPQIKDLDEPLKSAYDAAILYHPL